MSASRVPTITHRDRIDETAATNYRYLRGKPILAPVTTVIQDPDPRSWPKPIILAYDLAKRVWHESGNRRSWSTTELLELSDDYYECVSCGRVCDIEVDEPVTALRDRPHCSSCWGTKVDRWSEGEL